MDPLKAESGGIIPQEPPAQIHSIAPTKQGATQQYLHITNDEHDPAADSSTKSPISGGIKTTTKKTATVLVQNASTTTGNRLLKANLQGQQQSLLPSVATTNSARSQVSPVASEVAQLASVLDRNLKNARIKQHSGTKATSSDRDLTTGTVASKLYSRNAHAGYTSNTVTVEEDQEGLLLNQVSADLTNSQRQFLQEKREKMRNFLPQIYNSAAATLQEENSLAGSSAQSPSVKQFLQQYFLNEHSLATNPSVSIEQAQHGRNALHQQSTAMHTSHHGSTDHNESLAHPQRSQGTMDLPQSQSSPFEGDLLQKRLMQIESQELQRAKNDFNIGEDSIVETGSSLLEQEGQGKAELIHQAAIAIHQAAELSDELYQESSSYNQRLEQFDRSLQVNGQQRLNDPSSIMMGGDKSQPVRPQARWLNESAQVGLTVLNATSSARGGATASSRNRNSQARRNQSSDIFALKQISLQQSRNDLFDKIISSSVKHEKQLKRRERFLVHSVDLSNYLETSKKHQSRYQRRINAASLMHKSQEGDGLSGYKTKSHLLTPKNNAAMEVLANFNKRKKHFMVAPILKPDQQQPLGRVDEGNSVCQTLIGPPIPSTSRKQDEMPVETRMTFSPNRKSVKKSDYQTRNLAQSELKSVISPPETPNMPLLNSSQKNVLSLTKLQHTESQKFSELGGLADTSSPMLRKMITNNGQSDKTADYPYNTFKLDRILPMHRADNPLDQTPVKLPTGGFPPNTSTVIAEEENYSPTAAAMRKQGYSTMKLTKDQAATNSQVYLMSDYPESALAFQRDVSLAGLGTGTQKQLNEDVTSDLYSQREIEVLRAKIQKRIVKKHIQDQETEALRKTYQPETDVTKRGPNRLNMETISRKTVMKILQDNQQKLKQTRKEMISELKKERSARKNKNAVFVDSQEVISVGERGSAHPRLASSLDMSVLSNNGAEIRPLTKATANGIEDQSRKKAHSLAKRDQVLQSKIYERLSVGVPAITPRDDLISQLSKINDKESHGLYHMKLKRRQQRTEEKTKSFLSQSMVYKPKAANLLKGVMSSNQQSKDLPEYIFSKVKTQEDKDQEASNRLWLYQIDQLEQEALCRQQDEELLHGMLKYKMPQNIEVRPVHPPIDKAYRYDPPAPSLTATEQSAAEQLKYHNLASTFKVQKEGGRLMTRNEMETLLKKLQQQQINHSAANQPMYGEISYDRAVNEIFPASEHPDKQELELVKAMALLMRHESQKVKDKRDDEELVKEVELFVQKLLNEMPSIDSDYLDFYDTSQSPAQARSFNPGRLLKQVTFNGRGGQPAVSRFDRNSLHIDTHDLSRQMSAAPQYFMNLLSPIKANKSPPAIKRNQSIISIASTGSPKMTPIRKLTLGGLKRMANQRSIRLNIEKFPLKHLTADTTDEFNQNAIATQIYEKIHFFRVYKDSLSQVFLEKAASDFRLGFILQCLQQMDTVLPLFAKVQVDGTLYLKEYLLKEGHSEGLAVACSLNGALFNKVFIDNCGVSEGDMVGLMAGFSQLEVLSQLVLRRTEVSEACVPHLSDIMGKIFPNNLATLKIEKCQVSKEATLAICQALCKKSYVRTLSLVGVSFDEKSIRVLCEFLTKKKQNIEVLDLSDNRLEPKLFHPLLEAIGQMRGLKQINISWNLLLEKAHGPQIGTYVKEEKLIYGRANEPIEFPPPVIEVNQVQSSSNLDTIPQSAGANDIDVNMIQTLRSNPEGGNEGLLETDIKIESSEVRRMSETQQSMQANLSHFGQLLTSQQFQAATPVPGNSSQPYIESPRNPRDTATTFHRLEISSGTCTRRQPLTQAAYKMTAQEQQVCGWLTQITAIPTLVHLDYSDCGLTEGILLQLSKVINKSTSLCSAHLSGNTGLKEHVMRAVQGKLKATLEPTLDKQTFKPLIRMYDNKHNVQSQSEEEDVNYRSIILDQIEERDSLDSKSMLDFSEKHKMNPAKLKEQINYRNLLREKEPLLPVDDGKLSRDHRRHFAVSRVLGHELEIPGSQEWQVLKDSAQQCWVCDRKQFTFFFWSPEFGEFDKSKTGWLSQGDKQKIIETVFTDRETSNLLMERRTTLREQLNTPRHKKRFDPIKNQIQEISSEDVSENISQDDTDSLMESMLGSEKSPQKTISHQRSSKQSIGLKELKRRTMHLGNSISGSFNNWQPQPLIKVSHLARVLDKRPLPDFLAQCKEAKKCRKNISTYEEMTKREKAFYDTRVDAHQRSYNEPEVWGPLIAAFLRSKYKKTRIVGSENFDTLSPKTIYCCGAFLDMGKNNYIVTSGNRTYFHETNISYRRENLPTVSKTTANAKVRDRNADVFKFWQKDSPESLAKTYDTDFGYSKISAVVKDAATQEDVREVFLKHYDFIKDVYQTLIVNSSSFPYISSQEFSRFCKQIKIQDNVLNQSRIDYIVTNVKAKVKALDKSQLPNQGNLDLSRFEFVEALFRIAKTKYKDNAPNPAIVTVTDCIEKLIEENLRPNFEPAPWQLWREEELWTREVNLTFHDNDEGLRRLYQRYSKPGIAKLPYERALRLLTQDCSIKLDKFDATYCYGMSLSTCIDLHKTTTHKLLHMSYEEFLEMIGRAADLHFQGSTEEGLALWEKIMLILDELFLLVEDCVPVQPRWTEEEQRDDSEPDSPKNPLQKLMMTSSKIYSSHQEGVDMDHGYDSNDFN